VADIDPAGLVAAASFTLGLVFGATSWISGFCAMGALSDILFLDDWRRLRSWLLATAVALIGTQGLDAAGLVDLGRSVYLGGPLSWGGAILGGLMFGVGMTLAGGCGAKTVVRLGGGNLKSLVVLLVSGLFAMMTLKGLLAPLRQAWERLTPLGVMGGSVAAPSLPAVLEEIGPPEVAARGFPVALIAGGLVWWCLKDAAFRRSAGYLFGGLIIGLLIPAGWTASAILGADPFDPVPPTSFSFAAPIGGALIYLMTFTGASLSFGVAAVAGTLAGAFAAAALRREVRIEGFADTGDLRRHLAGAALMGTGGVLALGCTVGQGLTGLSTLSLSAPLALAAIAAGGVLGLKRLETGGFVAAINSLAGRGEGRSGGVGGCEAPPRNAGCEAPPRNGGCEAPPRNGGCCG